MNDLTGLPRIIWFPWFQGMDNAPEIVRRCYESWVTWNPAWRVIVMDDRTMPEFTTVDFSAGNLPTLSPVHKADLLRLDLLARHGGVWADATCVCARPLDEWLPERMPSGFFAFHRPGPGRIMSSWFLAAEPGHVLVSRLFQLMYSYWSGRPLQSAKRQFLVNRLNSVLRRSGRTRGWWFSPIVRNWLAVGPYYAIHYGFEKVVRTDPACREAWSRTPKVSAEGPHLLYRVGFLVPVTEAVRHEVARRQIPVFKTAWKPAGERIPGDTALGYLLEHTANSPRT